jgi:NAD(P)-dependent dehydrogenase (short-subunit alcohol dehydrogenase family)
MSTTIDNLFNVQGLNVLVSGGGRGIGLMIAKGFVENGANVYICSRDVTQIRKAEDRLNQLGPGKCYAFQCDLSDIKNCSKLTETLISEFKLTKLHVLVNNSGTSWGAPLLSTSEEGWNKVMNLNVKALFFLTKALVPLLENAASSDGRANIINIGSVAGIQHQVAPTYAYDVSKAAVIHLSKKLATDLAPININVNCIAPGLFPSRMSNQLLKYASESSLDAMVRNIPLGRLGKPQDMAGVCLFLSSRAGAYITGTVIPVDGGYLVHRSARL